MTDTTLARVISSDLEWNTWDLLVNVILSQWTKINFRSNKFFCLRISNAPLLRNHIRQSLPKLLAFLSYTTCFERWQIRSSSTSFPPSVLSLHRDGESPDVRIDTSCLGTRLGVCVTYIKTTFCLKKISTTLHSFVFFVK